MDAAAAADAAHKANVDARANALLSQMTLEEKLQLVRGWAICGYAFSDRGSGLHGAGFIPGIPRLGIPDLNMTDGGGGVADCSSATAPFVPRDKPYATALPAPVALAATWDTELANLAGALIATEARAQGFNMLLGGSIGLVRDPRLGRSFEYMGEDPVLSGLMVSSKIEGAQAQHIVMSLKHLAANTQETSRELVDSIVDERTLRELYLREFEIAVKTARPGSVMCSYNKLNGDWACENDWLLNTVLKREWGFQGWVQSDWGATHSTTHAALSGLDEEQYKPTFFGAPLLGAVADGGVPESRLDDMVRRKLVSLIDTGVLDDPPVPHDIDFAAGEVLAERVARSAMVLLKNEGGVLPLDKTLPRIAVIGKHADSAMISGGGSSQVISPGGHAHVHPAQPDQKCPEQPGPANWCEIWVRSSPLEAIQAKAPESQVRFADGSDVDVAVALAKDSDAVVVMAHQWSSEGQDLSSLTLRDDQDALIAAVSAANAKTIVVLQSGNPVLMPWLLQVPAVVDVWYAGIRGAPALADVLFGDVNPSGKLPLSFPAAEADTPTGGAPFSADVAQFTEGLSIGYRWYDERGVAPAFAFGHGLSYTAYRYEKVEVRADGAQVSFSLTNIGSRAGAEVVQVYVKLPSGAGDVAKRLVAWKRVSLAAGEKQQVSLSIPRDQLRYWDSDASSWKTASGTYGVLVGASSSDIKLQTSFATKP
ncbi:MAG: hypothetical protein RLZZ450_4192 [Pseudomonadota bacterium]|jgi:beta-glucosidase